MKKRGMIAVALGVGGLGLFLAGGAPAADHSMHGGGHAEMAASSGQAAQHGVVVREATVEGYRLKYVLLNWKERNEAMKGMEGMEMAGMDNSGSSTNHLVLNLASADGKPVAGAKVGFQVTRPDGGEQKTLTMAMGGYGADVNLKGKGVYTIKAKFVDGSRTVVDTFTYEVK